jgi:hypothetical protein
VRVTTMPSCAVVSGFVPPSPPLPAFLAQVTVWARFSDGSIVDVTQRPGTSLEAVPVGGVAAPFSLSLDALSGASTLTVASRVSAPGVRVARGGFCLGGVPVAQGGGMPTCEHVGGWAARLLDASRPVDVGACGGLGGC